MSDDASYMSFLNKANADPKAGTAQGSTMAESPSTSSRRSDLDPTSSTSGLPASLQSLPDVMYTSDTDSPFEPVLFNYSGTNLPSVSEFKKVLGQKIGDEVEELSVDEFDPRGEYKQIVQRVKEAGEGKGGLKVFRVQASKTKVEYYVLNVGEGKLIGVVTKAVES
jgi:hypothetical protein